MAFNFDHIQDTTSALLTATVNSVDINYAKGLYDFISVHTKGQNDWCKGIECVGNTYKVRLSKKYYINAFFVCAYAYNQYYMQMHYDKFIIKIDDIFNGYVLNFFTFENLSRYNINLELTPFIEYLSGNIVKIKDINLLTTYIGFLNSIFHNFHDDKTYKAFTNYNNVKRMLGSYYLFSKNDAVIFVSTFQSISDVKKEDILPFPQTYVEMKRILWNIMHDHHLYSPLSKLYSSFKQFDIASCFYYIAKGLAKKYTDIKPAFSFDIKKHSYKVDLKLLEQIL